jgi:hypothetical protein
VFCISSDINLRVRYITLFKTISAQAYEAYQLIKQGLCNIDFPAGTILPGGRILHELSKTQFYEDLGFDYT